MKIGYLEAWLHWKRPIILSSLNEALTCGDLKVTVIHSRAMYTQQGKQ